MSAPLSEVERAALRELGYSEAWLEAGLLDRALLAEQFERLQAGGTRKTGKYRAQALAAWQKGTAPIADARLDAFLSLMAADPDSKMAQSAIAELIQSPRISLEQLERIAQSDSKLMKRHEAAIRRSYLTRRLDQGVTDELLARVIEYEDASIQTKLVRDARLTRKHAELLAKRGANPTIRTQAQAWFQDKKAWK
jgi:hypothetical protein